MRTSEYVSLGHPDKVADYISSYLLDRFIEKDKNVRYAVEVQIKDEFVSLAGEVTSTYKMSEGEYRAHVIAAIEEVGYTSNYAAVWNADGKRHVIDPDNLEIALHISEQSPDIAQGVDRDGWGDQGIFFGYATCETPSLMPADWVMAKSICDHLYAIALHDPKWGFGLDIKTQVTLNDFNFPVKIVVACPVIDDKAANALKELVDTYTAPFTGCEIVINGTGAYVTHGPVGDSGTTGRKLAVDFYGGNCPIGGGSPWTKDPSKADLSLNLYARAMAREFIYNSKNRHVTVQVCSTIGKDEIMISTLDESGKVTANEVLKVTPKSLVNSKLDLHRPIYAKMCRFGLFGFINEIPLMNKID